MKLTKTQLRKWLNEWKRGRFKNDIERKELADPSSHGKRISLLWREELGVETEEEHPLVTENRELKAENSALRQELRARV